jgi:hypothetical protein
VPSFLNKSIKHIFAQVGGGTPAYNPFAPGSVNFAKPGGYGSGGINAYHEVPLDESLHRMNDASLKDDTLSVEKRLEIYHDDIENDTKAYALKESEREELKKSDANLRYVKLITDPPKDTKLKKYLEVGFEKLLDKARTNSDEKHPYEDVNPPTIKPSRVHTSQIYLNRTIGKSPFKGTEEDGAWRHPFDAIRQTLPPDGTPRSYPYRDQREIDEYLASPKDINFSELYGESLAFDHPQDTEDPNSTGMSGVTEVVKDITQKSKGQSNTETALEDWRENLKSTLFGGPGKARKMDEYFGDTRERFQEVMGVADKYPATPEKSVGMINWGFSSS